MDQTLEQVLRSALDIAPSELENDGLMFTLKLPKRKAKFSTKKAVEEVFSQVKEELVHEMRRSLKVCRTRPMPVTMLIERVSDARSESDGAGECGNLVVF